MWREHSKVIDKFEGKTYNYSSSFFLVVFDRQAAMISLFPQINIEPFEFEPFEPIVAINNREDCRVFIDKLIDWFDVQRNKATLIQQTD